MKYCIAWIIVLTTAGCSMSARQQKLADERAARAEAWFSIATARMAAKEPLTPEFIDQLVHSSRARAEARAAVAKNSGERVAAFQAHRDFCQSTLKDITRPDCFGHSNAILPTARLKYEIADAEYQMGS